MISIDLCTGYGNFKCSCGCGTPLEGTMVVVGDLENDYEGFEWRCFVPEHAHHAGIICGSWEAVYEKYPVAPNV